MLKDDKIFVAGHNGMVGSAIMRNLKGQGYNNIIFESHQNLDLTEQNEVRKFLKDTQPKYIFLAAAKVGGIKYNSENPGEFIYNNLAIQTNVIHEAYKHNVEKVCFLGSACIYPKVTQMPIKEEYLLTAPLEPSNEGYALAKIAGLKMCEYYRRQYGFKAFAVMPANLYGPNDNFNIEHCHVIPGLISKMIQCKISNHQEVKCWGDGSPTREFLHVDDLADAVVYLMNNYEDSEFLNIGSGYDISMKELAELIKELTNYKGNLIWDKSMPNGTPKRVMDNSKLFNMGWSPKIRFEQGLRQTIEWYVDNKL